MCTGSEGPVLHIFHNTIGHCDRHWRPHGCAKDLLKHFPSVSKVGGIQAEFEEVDNLIRRQFSSLGQRSVLNGPSCAMYVLWWPLLPIIFSLPTCIIQHCYHPFTATHTLPLCHRLPRQPHQLLPLTRHTSTSHHQVLHILHFSTLTILAHNLFSSPTQPSAHASKPLILQSPLSTLPESFSFSYTSLRHTMLCILSSLTSSLLPALIDSLLPPSSYPPPLSMQQP